MASFKKFSVLALIAIALLIFGGILHIIALATPYWHFTYEATFGRVGHYGLWVGCKYFLTTVSCSSEYINPPGWMQGVRAMDVLGMLLGTTALVLMGLYTFAPSGKWTTTYKVSSVVTALVAGLFVLIGAIIYGVSIVNGADLISAFPYNSGGLFLNGVYTHDLSWSFGISITAAILCVLSGVVMGFAGKRN
ncbi:uncharacterized protein [Argopecten irradians]|uniref:uncharacterized protein n=1 Tax=Argopecten irradians TaxID=31199 RepID=UPI0037202FFA